MSQAQAQAAYEENLRKALPDVSGNVWSDLIINELCYEDEVSDAILALLILKQFEQSTTGSSQEESTEDGRTQPTPDPRRDILSRKRARSPSRDLTPCPGLNREPMIAHARKRLCTQNFVPSTTGLRTETTTTNTPATTPSSSNNARRVLFGASAPPVAPPMQPIAPVNAPTTTRMPQPLHFNHPIRRGYRPDPICMKAMMDVKARMTGHATEAHIASVCRKFMVFPKLPAAYLAVCDDSKLELFWLFAGDMGPLQHRVLENCEPPRNLYEKGILKLRMGSRAAPLQHNSVLQTQHMKEIDARPRPSLQDRVKMWLANVTCP